MNFSYMAIEYVLATQSSSTKCLPYGCFLTKVMGFSRNEDGKLIRGGQEEESENSEEEEEEQEEEEGNEPEGTDEDEQNVEEIQRELRYNEEEKIKPLKTLKTYTLIIVDLVNP
ncbi:hypothetical protein M9H77_09267 [Catharanthus roseus]|uniref:Uncharacterized protein n=1 Tax=Catharanthus roseus TaxID=4058 RepID=A0ACC0C0A2_CATRO|nr:hypothetical protein M9H77_09267 [Catharanthus roseus]